MVADQYEPLTNGIGQLHIDMTNNTGQIVTRLDWMTNYLGNTDMEIPSTNDTGIASEEPEVTGITGDATNEIGGIIDKVTTSLNPNWWNTLFSVQLPTVGQKSSFEIQIPESGAFFKGTNMVCNLAYGDIVPAIRVFELYVLYGLALYWTIIIVRKGIA